MYEKLENCPHCDKPLDQQEYDGQFCRPCDTDCWGFSKKKERNPARILQNLLKESGHETDDKAFDLWAAICELPSETTTGETADER